MGLFCPACGHGEGEIIASWADWERACQGRDDGPMRLAAATTAGVADQTPDLWQCHQCYSVSMTIIPTGEQLAAFYSNYHATDDFVQKAPKKVTRALKRILPFRLRHGAGRFLEVGASIGTAAEAARRLGYNATAQEIDGDAVARGEAMYAGISFINGFIEDVPNDPPFDLVYAAEVIEHVPDPTAFARQLFERTAKGGRLYVTTPDAGHAKRPEPFVSWLSVKPPEHITLFTQQGLRTLIERAGFANVKFHRYAKPGIRMSAMRPH